MSPVDQNRTAGPVRICPAPGKGEWPVRILVVDDSIVFRTFFRKSLEDVPEVESLQFAPNGRQALFLLGALTFDLVILDLEMPVVDGYETLEEIRRKWPEQRVIVCSGKTLVNFDAIQRVLALGADGVVSKSYQKDNVTALDPVAFRAEMVPRILKMYKENRRPVLTETLGRAYSRDIIDGILVIHLLERNESMMQWDGGPLDQGLGEVQKVLETAVRTLTPVFLDESIRMDPGLAPVRAGLQHVEPELYHDMGEMSEEQLALDWVHPAMAGFLQKHSIGNLLICGFNRSCCVENAASQISRYYGINIVIGESLLFGNVREQRDAENVREKTMEFFRENYICLESTAAVQQALLLNHDEKRQRFKALS